MRPTYCKMEACFISNRNEEPERECRRHRMDGMRVLLNLASVSFVDRQGLGSLKRILSADISVVNWPPLVESLFLDEQGK